MSTLDLSWFQSFPRDSPFITGADLGLLCRQQTIQVEEWEEGCQTLVGYTWGIFPFLRSWRLTEWHP